MEFIWFTTDQLNEIARRDPILKKYFVKTSGCDELPEYPDKINPRAYIVNTDPSNRPGQHWIGIWTENNTCEIMDSYGLPLSHYDFILPFVNWLEQWPQVVGNSKSIQSIETASCGDYALVYLMTKARGEDMKHFLSYFSDKDFVGNDDKVGDMLEEIITFQINE